MIHYIKFLNHCIELMWWTVLILYCYVTQESKIFVELNVEAQFSFSEVNTQMK